MLAEVGLIALTLAFAAALYGAVASVVGGRRHSDGLVQSARNATLLVFPLLVLACLALVAALLRGDYQISYVWAVSSPSTPTFFRVTALWGSQEGSLLFWNLIMSGFTAAALIFNWRSQRRLMPYVITYTSAVLVFFLGLVLFAENPFTRYWIVTGDEAASRGSDVLLTDTGDNPQAILRAIAATTGLSEAEAQAVARSVPFPIASCVTGSNVTRVAASLEAAGGTAAIVPAERCTTEAALIPPNAVAPSASRLAETANGLNPLLRHFGMIIHPPLLYLGFTGFVIPFAFAMAALASGDLSTHWIKATRRWSLIAWLFLSLGLLLGGRWAYDVLGWGGYWGWDPVENAAFLPWLIGTAFIHSVMVQEKRGMLKVWNMFLVILTFSAVIFGTFATRSGLVESVHSFAESGIGFPMFLFWAGVTLVSVTLILWRWNRGELKSEHSFGGVLGRESLFVLNNVIFIALFLAIFWGSFGAPILSEIALGVNITLGLEYFNQVTPPLFLALYVLMGIAPLSAWSATSLRRLGRALTVPLVLTAIAVLILLLTGTRHAGALIGYGIVLFAGFVALYEIYRGAKARHSGLGEGWSRALTALFARNRRRYGGYIVHLGITIIGIGVIGSTLFQAETQRTLRRGESLELRGYTMRYDDLTFALADDGRNMSIANVTVSNASGPVAQLRPRQDLYPDMPMTIAGAVSPFPGTDDFYVLLSGWEAGGSTATFKVYHNPLINLVWWGGLILIAGTLLAAWKDEPLPLKNEARARSRVPANGRAGAVA